MARGDRERVLSDAEQACYLRATGQIAQEIDDAYQRALNGTRAARGKEPIKPEDPYLLRDVATILLDCALRHEECFRLRWPDVRDGALNVFARRRIPLTPRVLALLEMRRNDGADWVFPAPTKSGHIEKSTLKKPHKKTHAMAKIEPFTLYTLRHTCLTRWAEVMDPCTFAYLAGHADFSTTKRYVHPQTETVLAALNRSREVKSGHSFGHSEEKTAEGEDPSAAVTTNLMNV